MMLLRAIVAAVSRRALIAMLCYAVYASDYGDAAPYATMLFRVRYFVAALECHCIRC